MKLFFLFFQAKFHRSGTVSIWLGALRTFPFIWSCNAQSFSFPLCDFRNRYFNCRKFQKESISYSIKSGQGFMIFPNQICTYIADAQQPWEYVWIEFDGLRAKETVELSGLCVNSPVYKAKYKDVAQTMKDEMLYIINHKDDSPFHLIGHLYLLSIAS